MIELIINDFSKEYKWHWDCSNPKAPTAEQDINSGLCDLFALEVKKHYPQTVIHYDEDLDHYYCEIDGLFYDAENPNGVDNPSKMSFLGVSILSDKLRSDSR